MPCGTNIEVMAITITLLNINMNIYNIYRKRNREYPGELQLGQLFALAGNHPTLICGDFNAHHPILSSPSPTNEAGEHLCYILEEIPEIALLNNGQPTHMRGGRLDLTFLSTNLRPHATWQVHPTLMSDHFATNTKIELP